MADAQGDAAEFQSDRGVFRAEYERELGQWLRRRLGWLCAVYALFQLIGVATLLLTAFVVSGVDAETAEHGSGTESPPIRMPSSVGGRESTTPSAPIGRIVDRWWEDTVAPIAAPGEPARSGMAAPDAPAPEPEASANGHLDVSDAEADRPIAIAVPWWVWTLLSLPSLGVVAWFGLRVRPTLFTRAEAVAAASRMILTLGFLNFGLEASMLLADPSASVAPLFSIFFWHLTASLFLPWSWRESLRPVIPLFVAWVLLRAGLASGDGSWIRFGLTVGFSPLLFLPALVFCYARLRWHQNRFKSGFVGRRFLQMRREFIQARAVHESLFPKPIDSGWIRFEFGYRPAADIGGDFVHVWIDERERFHLALIDVTGHGLASAMSVARIHGEIERLRDEYPDEGPAKILARLNRYFHRLLAKHRLYATGVLLTIDPVSGEARYASAGHPPVFLRSRGRVTELPSTTFLLGAVDDALFGEEEFSTRLTEGDTLVLFTDGAYDARNPRGERFGLDRLREILQRPVAPPRWSSYLLRLVETFEAGMPEDDLLIAEVSFRGRRSFSSITGDELPPTVGAAAGARA